MQKIYYPQKSEWDALLQRPALRTEELFGSVQALIDEVRRGGDAAVLALEERFDKVQLSQ